MLSECLDRAVWFTVHSHRSQRSEVRAVCRWQEANLQHLQPDFDAGDSPHRTLTVATSELGCGQALTLIGSSFG